MSDFFQITFIRRGIMQNSFSNKGLPRRLEIFLAFSGLILLFPVLLLCALLVRLSSRGAVLFRQIRVGRSGKPFTLYKFRTMYESKKGSLITSKTDHRITFWGKILRNTKLDELPELYNILRGDMSFVGPRPEVPDLVDLSNPAWQKILTVRPGLTDPVTIQLRNEEILLAEVEDKERFYLEILQPFKMNGYLEYVKNKCWQTDLKIIFQTFKVIVFPPKSLPILKNPLKSSVGTKYL